MNDRQVDSFIQAATYLNFHKAAQTLRLTQPALSYQIQSLEKELGFDLFNRTPKGVQLTAAGKSLYKSLLEINTLLNRAIDQARSFANVSSDRLTLAWPPSILDRNLLLNMSTELRSKLPGEDFIFLMSDKTNSIDMVEEGNADITISIESDVKGHSGLESAPLFEAQRCCLVSADHPLARLNRVSWNMLRTQTILLAPPNRYPNSYAQLMADLEQAHIPSTAILYMDDLADIDINIAAGKGVAVRPRPAWTFGKEQNGIFTIPFDDSPVSTICVAYALDQHVERKRKTAQAMQTFCRNIEKQHRGDSMH